MENVFERIEYLNQELAKRYKQIDLNGRTCFRTDSGDIICLDSVFNKQCVVVEYAENVKAAKNNLFEDGDLFDMELPPDRMLRGMLSEIEQ